MRTGLLLFKPSAAFQPGEKPTFLASSTTSGQRENAANTSVQKMESTQIPRQLPFSDPHEELATLLDTLEGKQQPLVAPTSMQPVSKFSLKSLFSIFRKPKGLPDSDSSVQIHQHLLKVVNSLGGLSQRECDRLKPFIKDDAFLRLSVVARSPYLHQS